MGAVDHRQHARGAGPPAQILDVEQERGRRRDVADGEDPRAVGRRRPDGVGIGAGRADDTGAGARGDVVEEGVDAGVLVRRREDLVPGPQRDRAQGVQR
jgi:hypothetical protein